MSNLNLTSSTHLNDDQINTLLKFVVSEKLIILLKRSMRLMQDSDEILDDYGDLLDVYTH